jgi:ABC-type glycerol-3-phosphate transport system substrate-binding protein
MRLGIAAMLAMAISTALLLLGCATGTEKGSDHLTQDGRVIVRISLYNSSSFPEWRAYVEKQCPDVYIQWEDNRNYCSNVVYQAEHDDIPDLVGIRRFESDSADKLEPYLADLSDLPLTQTFNESDLVPFQSDGKQYWLPEPGTVEGFWANETLFKQYGVELPHDLDSLVASCQQMEALGKVPLACSCTQGYSCLALLEGFGSTGFLGTDAGRAWRTSFEQGTATSVDANDFASMMTTLCRLRDAGAITGASASSTPIEVSTQMNLGQAAIALKASDGVLNPNSSYSFAALPYFGQTEADSCLYTYPVFSLAMSKEAAGDASREQACSKVLSAMFGEDAQKILAKGTEGLISFSKDVELPLSSSMESVQPLIEARRYYIRAMNSNTFPAATKAIKALADGADSASLVSTLDASLFVVTEPVEVGTSKVAASSKLDESMCSEAGSVIAQAVRFQTGADIAVIDAREASSPIYRGRYTDVDLQAVAWNGPLYTGRLTGAQVRELLDEEILCSTTFSQGSTEPLVDYPALAGAKVTMQKDGTIEWVADTSGSGIDDGATYSVTISDRIRSALKVRGSGLLGSFSKLDKDLVTCLGDQLASADGLDAPEAYYVVS